MGAEKHHRGRSDREQERVDLQRVELVRGIEAVAESEALLLGQGVAKRLSTRRVEGLHQPGDNLVVDFVGCEQLEVVNPHPIAHLHDRLDSR